MMESKEVAKEILFATNFKWREFFSSPIFWSGITQLCCLDMGQQQEEYLGDLHNVFLRKGIAACNYGDQRIKGETRFDFTKNSWIVSFQQHSKKEEGELNEKITRCLKTVQIFSRPTCYG